MVGVALGERLALGEHLALGKHLALGMAVPVTAKITPPIARACRTACMKSDTVCNMPTHMNANGWRRVPRTFAIVCAPSVGATEGISALTSRYAIDLIGLR
jgi:hypothetical protein